MDMVYATSSKRTFLQVPQLSINKIKVKPDGYGLRFLSEENFTTSSTIEHKTYKTTDVEHRATPSSSFTRQCLH